MTPLSERLQRRTILLSLGMAMATLALIGIIGMAASVAIVEKVRGSASAINVSGSLRMQSHRMGSLVLTGIMENNPDRRALSDAMVRFESSLYHLSLRLIEEREPDKHYAQMYRSIKLAWETDLKPLLNAHADRVSPTSPLRHRELLQRIDRFVYDINQMVAQLEHDTEAKISLLHSSLAVALTLIFIVLLAVLYGVSTRVILPLNRLVESANAFARGNFRARASHTGADELGRVGLAFNYMADELARLYDNLEQRVNEKTEQLTRSNQSLELLYHSIARLYNAPVAPETYRAMLVDLERVLGLRHSMACLLPEQDGMSHILASTLDACPSQGFCENITCAECLTHSSTWRHEMGNGNEVLAIPLKDAEQYYGVLKLNLSPGHQLAVWQQQLVDALSQHIGIAIGIARQAEKERRLALMDERSVIARELHDSLAQALSYMKIQVALLQQQLMHEQRNTDTERILLDLREGISAAYRQLRELLATFRLRMEGDFLDLLKSTAEEYTQRGQLQIDLSTHLDHCQLSPNQEIHILQIVREALNNIVRHAEAQHAWIKLDCDPQGMLTVLIEDDGKGLQERVGISGHYGLAIMNERAHSLKGSLQILPRHPTGTCVSLRFNASPGQALKA